MLDELSRSTEWKLWSDLRNRMAHRAALPRVIYGTMGGTLPPARAINFAETSSTPAFVADTAGLEHLLDWLAQTLRLTLVSTRKTPEDALATWPTDSASSGG